MKIKIINGDCIETMKHIKPNMIDSIVTDPPYGIAFMGKDWDNIPDLYNFTKAWADEAIRVLKPGGYALVFGSPRTFHREMCGLEDAGFELRDTLMWIYSSGFPKGLNISRGIDKKFGAEREVIGHYKLGDRDYSSESYNQKDADKRNLSMGTEKRKKALEITGSVTPEAK